MNEAWDQAKARAQQLFDGYIAKLEKERSQPDARLPHKTARIGEIVTEDAKTLASNLAGVLNVPVEAE